MAAGNPTELEFPEGTESDVMVELARTGVAGGLGDEDLTAVPRRSESCHEVDVHADIALVTDLGFAGVEADADLHRGTLRPLMVAQPPLDSYSRRQWRGT